MRSIILSCIAFAISLAVMIAPAQAEQLDQSLVRKKSAHSVEETLNRAQMIVEERGGTVFARIDHAKGAERIFEKLRPTQVLLFGNPKAGTPLMQQNQEIGVDLPMRLLAYEDAKGQVWVAYHDPRALVKPHGADGMVTILTRISETLDKLTNAITKPAE